MRQHAGSRGCITDADRRDNASIFPQPGRKNGAPVAFIFRRLSRFFPQMYLPLQTAGCGRMFTRGETE